MPGGNDIVGSYAEASDVARTMASSAAVAQAMSTALGRSDDVAANSQVVPLLSPANLASTRTLTDSAQPNSNAERTHPTTDTAVSTVSATTTTARAEAAVAAQVLNLDGTASAKAFSDTDAANKLDPLWKPFSVLLTRKTPQQSLGVSLEVVGSQFFDDVG